MVNLEMELLLTEPHQRLLVVLEQAERRLPFQEGFITAVLFSITVMFRVGGGVLMVDWETVR
jgi:hypothetical protein